MMMAHDSTPGRAMPSAEALDALRSALEEYLISGGKTPSLQPALRRIAQEPDIDFEVFNLGRLDEQALDEVIPADAKLLFPSEA